MTACITSLGQVQSHTRPCVFPSDTNVICSVTVGFENYTDARNFPSPVANMVIFVLGEDEPGDGGEGWFWYNAESTATDDSGTVLKPSHIPTGTAGRFIRLRL